MIKMKNLKKLVETKGIINLITNNFSTNLNSESPEREIVLFVYSLYSDGQATDDERGISTNVWN